MLVWFQYPGSFTPIE